jgi:hypothetical protein
MLEHPGLKSVAVAAGAVVLALLPLATSAAHAAAPAESVASTYSFAQSSLAGGGFENVIAADPFHPDVVLSGSDVGGIDRSTDSGERWLAAQGGSLDQTNNPIAALLFDPKSRNDVYAASDSGVAESTNDGVSWTPLPALPFTGLPFNGSNDSNPYGTTSSERCVGNLLAIDDARHLVYAATYNDGVWRYDIATQAWSQIVQQAQLNTQLGSDFCQTSLAWGPRGTLDVATWGAGVSTVTDPSGAATVQAVLDSPPTVQELVGLVDGDVWGAAYNSGVGEIPSATSTTWEPRLPETASENYLSIAGYVNGGADVVIAGSDNSPQYDVLHETWNSGSTWTPLPSPTAPDNVSTDLLGGTLNPWWHGGYQPALLWSTSMVPSSIVIEHEKKGDNMWIAGYGGNWRLLGAEGQTTFYPSDYGIGSTVNHQVVIDSTTVQSPHSNQGVYLGDTDWGMLSSVDGFSTQQGITDNQFTGGTDAIDTVVDGEVSPPFVYAGVGNRNTNTQGDLLSAQATSSLNFAPTGLGAATGGGRPLAVGVVDPSGTPTLIVAVEASGMWTRIGSASWVQDTSLFTLDPTNTPTAAIAVDGQTVYAYYPQRGLYRSLDAGAPGSWQEIWVNTSVAYAPFLMVDNSGSIPRLWVIAAGGLYALDNPATTTTYTSVSPVIAGNASGLPALSGLAELNGQVFTTELSLDARLEVLVNQPNATTFAPVISEGLSDTQAIVSSIAVANDGTVYIATAGSGLIVGTPVDTTSTTLTSSTGTSKAGQPVTFTATILATEIGDTPSGIVVFTDGAKKLGSATLNASGVASFSTKALKKGSNSIVAKYQGNMSDDPSTSNAVTVKVT